MSRIGKRPVAIPSGVTATIDAGQLSVKGPKGTLAMPLADDVAYTIGEGEILVKPANATKQARAFWGMQRTLVQNLVTGVTEGFTKVLEITGVGNDDGEALELLELVAHRGERTGATDVPEWYPAHRGRPVTRRSPQAACAGAPSRSSMP